MKLVTVVGARPQFIKAAPVSKALREAKIEEFIVHTGQHYDTGMSDIFFEELGIPLPNVNLNVGSASHGAQTAAMLTGIEQILIQETPDWLLVYGDTNSTLAGALAASKLGVKIVHIEAGLRSFNRRMPEEINRVVTDHLADLLLCPSRTAVQNLALEGIQNGVHLVGDVMHDSVIEATRIAEGRLSILSSLGLKPKTYALATVHRAENTDNLDRLRSIFATLSQMPLPVIFPVHPRTRNKLHNLGMSFMLEEGSLTSIDPVGYLDMLMLQRHASIIFTDSGGIQKEACWLKVPCVTLREETEWVETIEAGVNRLVGADADRIRQTATEFLSQPPSFTVPLYGDGNAACYCVEAILAASRSS